jgi:hypothetical protein
VWFQSLGFVPSARNTSHVIASSSIAFYFKSGSNIRLVGDGVKPCAFVQRHRARATAGALAFGKPNERRENCMKLLLSCGLVAVVVVCTPADATEIEKPLSCVVQEFTSISVATNLTDGAEITRHRCLASVPGTGDSEMESIRSSRTMIGDQLAQ